MKILFVGLPWTDDLGRFAKIAKKRNSQPSLGILYLAAVAERRNHEVKIIDAEIENYNIDSLSKRIISESYDLIGITATSPIFHKAVQLAKKLKLSNIQSPILIGGEHINIFKTEAFFDYFDFGFYGESDISFNDFLKVYENKDRNYKNIKGLIYRDNGKVIINEAQELIVNLDNLLFPAMHLLKYNSYIMSFAKFKRRRYLPIMATRGCPFKCVFCSEPLTNPFVRFRSAENVCDEIQKWSKELNISHFFFMDSNLTLNKNQIEKFCEEILKRRLDITWEGWTRADLIDKKLFKLMKRAGLIRISYGIESGDPQILKIIKKEVSLEEILNAFQMTNELGIEPACSAMIGLPGETKASVEKTIEFVKNIPQILYSNFSIANPYPGTEMYNWALEGKYGLKLIVDNFGEFTRYDRSPISVNDLSQEDLVRLQKIGLLKIHLTPKRTLAAIRILGFWNLILFLLSLLFVTIKKLNIRKDIYI